MNVSVSEVKPAFQPFKVTIEVNTIEEFRALYTRINTGTASFSERHIRDWANHPEALNNNAIMPVWHELYYNVMQKQGINLLA